MLERMALLLWSGGPWRTLGAGSTTVFQTFTKWTAAGVFELAYAAVLRLERRPLKRNVRVECIDSSYVKSIYGRDCIGRNPTERGPTPHRAPRVDRTVLRDSTLFGAGPRDRPPWRRTRLHGHPPMHGQWTCPKSISTFSSPQARSAAKERRAHDLTDS